MTTPSDNPYDEAPYDPEPEMAEMCKRHKIRPATQLEITNLAATLLASSTDKDKPIQERTWEAVHLAIKLWHETEAQLLDHKTHETNPSQKLPNTMGIYCQPMQVSNHFLPYIEGGFEWDDSVPYKKFLKLTVGLTRQQDREKWFADFLQDSEKMSVNQAAVQLEKYQTDDFSNPAITARQYRVWRIGKESNNPSASVTKASKMDLQEALEAGKEKQYKLSK